MDRFESGCSAESAGSSTAARVVVPALCFLGRRARQPAASTAFGLAATGRTRRTLAPASRAARHAKCRLDQPSRRAGLAARRSPVCRLPRCGFCSTHKNRWQAPRPLRRSKRHPTIAELDLPKARALPAICVRIFQPLSQPFACKIIS